jgi:hypothetical protein
VKLHKYQSVQEVIDEVKSPSDVEALRAYITETAMMSTDGDTVAYLAACRAALSIYERGFFRRWSTAFLQAKLAECWQQHNVRYASIYEAEIWSRKG